MQYTYETCAKTQTVTYKFATGVKLVANSVGGNGCVEYPGNEKVAPITFPINHWGEVFQYLRKGCAVSELPQRCKAW